MNRPQIEGIATFVLSDMPQPDTRTQTLVFPDTVIANATIDWIFDRADICLRKEVIV